MTREEAIKEMERMKIHGWCKTEAINMAIKALEQPESDDWSEYSSKLWKTAYERGKKEIEQPKVTRCWECKWHEGTNFCGNFNVIEFYPNDYCSLAERKKE